MFLLSALSLMPAVPDAPPAFTCARVAVERAPGEYAVTNAAWLRSPPTPHGADVEAIVDRLCVQPHLAEAVLSKLVGVLQPQR